MAELQVAYVNNDNLLRVDGLRAVSVQSGGPTNTASVTVTLIVSGGSQVSGVSWPVGLTLVTSGSGTGENVRGSRWEGILPDSLDLTADQHYQAQVTATAGAGFKGYWTLPIQAKNREL